MFTNLAAQSERLAVGRQQKFDRPGIESNSVVERVHLVPLINTANDHHSHENLKISDLPRIASEEWFDCERPVSFDNHIDPGRRNIHPRKLFDDFVYLDDDNRIVKCCRFNDHRRIFRARSRVQIAVTIGLFRAHQHNIRRQVDKQAGVEFNVCVNGSDFEDAILEQLRHPEALRACIRKVDLLRDSQLEKRELLRPADAGDD
jgi:hypothetical protein